MSSLRGKRVLVTRPRVQADGLVEALVELGAAPVVFPTIEIAPLADTAPLDRAIAELEDYRWVVFTSVNGVAAFWQRLAVLGKGQMPLRQNHVAAIGPATAQALRDRGVAPDFVPLEYVAEAILPGLGDVAGQRILLPRAEIARKTLLEELQVRGALVEEIAVYRTVLGQPDRAAWAALEGGLDWATFTSSSTVRNYFTLLGDRAKTVLRSTRIACIGPITAATAHSHGLAVDLVAAEYSIAGLVQALAAYDPAEQKERNP